MALVDGLRGTDVPNSTAVPSLMLRNPVVRWVILGATAGAFCGLFDFVLDCVNWGLNEKMGAVFQFGVQSPFEVGLFALGGMGIGLVVGLVVAIVHWIN
jgi:hypothetical protein